jgi:hypothetical protein
MSHIIIEITIKDTILKIKSKNKITELKENEIIWLFCTIDAFNKLEMNKYENEYNNAVIKIKYVKNMLITENINIFKIIRIPVFSDFVNYFINIKEKYNSQSNDTKLMLNDYNEQTENISQEIIITMIFNIKTSINEIELQKNELLELLKINNMDTKIFDILKMNK